MIPNPELEILDMLPRTDIIEDQVYRKAIPKQTLAKVKSFRQLYSEKLDTMPSKNKFFTEIAKDNIKTVL